MTSSAVTVPKLDRSQSDGTDVNVGGSAHDIASRIALTLWSKNCQ